MAIAFIGLGSNLGDREANLTWAIERVSQLPESRLVRTSCWIETEPVGGPPQGMYLNSVAELETQVSPQSLLAHLKEIERRLGRFPSPVRWGPRPIDLDLLSYDDSVVATPELTLPHPRMHERRFVLLPLQEVAPHWVHPKLKKSVAKLLEECSPRADHPLSE